MGGAAGLLTELTWEGDEVFTHTDLDMHHDFVKLANGHFIYLDWDVVPKALQARVQGGVKGTEHTGGMMFNDRLVEIDEKGRVVWEWHANEHLNPKIDIIGPLYKRQEWCHGNNIDVLSNGNVLLTSRSLDTIMIIDKKTGKIVFRWGSPSAAKHTPGSVEADSDLEHLGAPHGGIVIPAGYPGAGNLLCFSNRTTDGDFVMSRAAEIDPTTGKQVWETPTTAMGRKLFSDYLGNAQRLPNGNTMVCDGGNGHFFQMTKDFKVAWEYVNPHFPTPRFRGAVFKAYSYAPSYCPQFKSLPAAGGTAISPPVLQEFRVADTQADRFAWRLYALIFLACALVASLGLNWHLWRSKRDA
jgi:hypothetical protein